MSALILRLALLTTTAERTRRRALELLADAEAKASSGSLRRDLLQEAIRLETLAEQAKRELLVIAR